MLQSTGMARVVSSHSEAIHMQTTYVKQQSLQVPRRMRYESHGACCLPSLYENSFSHSVLHLLEIVAFLQLSLRRVFITAQNLLPVLCIQTSWTKCDGDTLHLRSLDDDHFLNHKDDGSSFNSGKLFVYLDVSPHKSTDFISATTDSWDIPLVYEQVIAS
jgi:hypothetical protein